MNGQQTTRNWSTKRELKEKRMERISKYLSGGKFAKESDMVAVLENVMQPCDYVILEGNNQKQASFLSAALNQVNPSKIHDLTMIMSTVARPEHLDIFEKGIAKTLEFSFSGPQSVRIAQMIEDHTVKVGNLHTYLELYGRLFLDLTPNIALVAADMADKDGNLYTGANTEDTPVYVESTAFKNGIVIVQVNQIVDKLPRIDIPGGWVDVIVQTKDKYDIEPLFTRDPKQISENHILIAMLALRGVYEKHNVTSLNHGIGLNTAAIELILPTYGEKLGLRGKIAKNWILNPHPTLIPAIESGWVESIHCFGGEVGMEAYTKARPDIYFTGRDGSLRSNRAFAQVAGQYAVDMFVGSTLQMDSLCNSSTVTSGRLSGFGGAPNMGHNPGGRRHSTPAWLDLMTSNDPLAKGKKLVLQTVETFATGSKLPVFVESLDAIKVGKEAGLPVAPVMIYGDDVTHVVTEEGVAYVYKAMGDQERKDALAAIAGVTPLGQKITYDRIKDLRNRGIVALPEDLNINRTEASRSLLAAKNINELVEWSGGLYNPPAKFKNW